MSKPTKNENDIHSQASLEGFCAKDSPESQKTEAMLREKEWIFSESQRLAHIGSWWWNLKGPIKWTDETYRVYGVSPEIFKPTIESLISLIHPDDQPAMGRWLEACRAGLSPEALEFRTILPDGSVRFISGTGNLVYDTENNPAFMAGTVQDITARKQAEQALQKERSVLTTVINAIPDEICVKDTQGRFVVVNEALAKALGARSPDELIGKTDYDYMPQEWASAHLAEQKVILESGRAIINRELLALDPKTGGMKRCILNTNVPVKSPDGTSLGLLAINRDITERKEAEEALRKSESEFHSLAEAMPQIVWITRADGWNIYFNQQWVDYTGLTLEESCGHGWNKPFHPDDQQRAWDAWQNATKHGAEYSLECRLRRADGVYRWWLIRGVPVSDASGTIRKWFGTCTDIHELKHAEEALAVNIRELNQALEQIKTLRGILPICSHCKKIRDDQGYWNKVEAYISQHTEAQFSHGICPDCLKKLYPTFHRS